MSNAAHIFQPECTPGSSALWQSKATQGRGSGQSVCLLLMQVGAGRFRAMECGVASEETFGNAIHEALVSRASPLLVRSLASGLFMRPAARRRSASASPPFGSWFLPEPVPASTKRASLLLGTLGELSGALQESATWHLGAWPTRSGFANG